MIAERGHRTVAGDRVLVGIAIGAVGGVLAVAFGIPGLATMALLALLTAFVAPRPVALAGLLTGAGTVWTFFTTLGVVRCAVSPEACSGPSPVPFAVGSVVVLAVGLLLLARLRPARALRSGR